MSIKILVVDDEAEIVESVTRLLRMEGYDVTGATNPLKALEMVKNDNYMLLITDIQMPELRGTELLKETKDYNGMIQVIVITGYVSIEIILTCLELGASDIFFKPLKDRTLFLDAVKTASGKIERWHSVISEMVKAKVK